MLGTVPKDAVGLVIGDPLRAARTIIAGKLDDLVDQIHKRRNVRERLAVSPSLGIPLLQAAYDEARPELQELWAELIASAEDPHRTHLVRKSFIDKLKQFDPYDALVLRARHGLPENFAANVSVYNVISERLEISQDDVFLSVDHLVQLGCAEISPINPTLSFLLSRYGKALMRACSD